MLKEMYKFHSFARVYQNRACICAYLMHCSCVLKRADKNNFSKNLRTDPTEYWKNLDLTQPQPDPRATLVQTNVNANN